MLRYACDWQLHETIDGEAGARFADNHEIRRYLNFFAKTDFELFPNWIISAGANIHFLTFELKDEFEDEQDLSGDYSYNPVISPRIGFSGDITPHITLFGAAGHGFSPPSVEETLLPEGNINIDLKPEEGYNYETGIRGNILTGKIKYDITTYYMALKNLLVTKRESEEIFYGINAGQTSHYGVESRIQAHLTNTDSAAPLNASVTLTHTWMKNRFEDFIDDGNDFSGNRLPGIPEQQMRISADFIFKKHANISLSWKYQNKMFLDDANTKSYPGHHISTLKAGWNITRGTQTSWYLQAGIDNIFDRHYASMVLVNAPSFGNAAPRYYYPGAPRNAWARIIIKFRDK